MKKTIITAAITLVALFFDYSAQAQSKIVKDFAPVCDSLSVLIKERTGVAGRIGLQSIMTRGSALDFYFTWSLAEYQWTREDVMWFRTTLRSLYPEKWSSYKLGSIYSKKENLDKLITPEVGNTGLPNFSRNRVSPPKPLEEPLVRNLDSPISPKHGLSGRYLALWASHGRYFDLKERNWKWQRPCLFETVEDIFTSSFMLDFLVPMLENAGGYVLLPRERDASPIELIIDNDPGYEYSGEEFYRGGGSYSESGSWKSAEGFADAKAQYIDNENPFTMGTCRWAKAGSQVSAQWTSTGLKRGKYAVYVSYRTFDNSSATAHYSVNHLGGVTSFSVNQTIGGGIWIYLGDFEMDESCSITLDSKGCKKGEVICADAVKIGGGMGNIARYNLEDDPEEAQVSTLPRYVECARYWLQWAGMDSTVFSQNKCMDDYKDDLYARPEWIDYLSGGSVTNPSKPGLGIPVNLSMAMHTDAGKAPGDKIIGTLAIYSSENEKTKKLGSGEPMKVSREFTALVQRQLVQDLKAVVDTTWIQRRIWDKNYRESRFSPVPSVLLEILSHQNFADMRLGQDPEFRFITCRAVYKAMLKYLSNRYGVSYAVQPLPVNSFAARLMTDKVELSWKETPDPLEPTAAAKGYVLYTRIGDGGFDNGKVVETYQRGERTCCTLALEEGQLASFRIAAFNDGGLSFPSETLCAGIPAASSRRDSTVLVVNNFTRVGPPAWFEGKDHAGFTDEIDHGVGYLHSIGYAGSTYNHQISSEYLSNSNGGFGACFTDMAGKRIAGNSFDYAFVHAKAVMEAGYPVCSVSAEAFCTDHEAANGAWAADIICGKQITTPLGRALGRQRFSIFPSEMQEAIRNFTSNGGRLIISGEYIATDIWSSIYPISKDKDFTAKSKTFAKEVLGYTWGTNAGGHIGKVRSCSRKSTLPAELCLNTELNDEIYPVETPDGIEPVGEKSKTVLRYCDSGLSAAVLFTPEAGYKAISLGFPIEAIASEPDRNALLGALLDLVK